MWFAIVYLTFFKKIQKKGYGIADADEECEYLGGNEHSLCYKSDGRISQCGMRMPGTENARYGKNDIMEIEVFFFELMKSIFISLYCFSFFSFL
jgi:hypothetical protein